jgi:hypothetical protein
VGEKEMQKLLVLFLILALAGGSILLINWSGIITVDKPPAEITYVSSNLTAEAAPYETLYIDGMYRNGVGEQPGLGTPYRIATVHLNSDKVKVCVELEVQGADSYNITVLAYKGVAIQQVKLSPCTILEKRASQDWDIGVVGWVRTSNTTQVKLSLKLTVEPQP